MKELALLPVIPIVAPPPGCGLDGVIVGVCAADLYLAKACCASVRRFMGDIPITLLADGRVNTSALESVFGAKRLAVADAAPAELVDIGRGTALPKLSVFWASPYERFLFLDADTLVWGDVRIHAALDRFDYVAAHQVPTPGLIPTEKAATESVFDVAALRRFDDNLQFLNRPFLVTGVFMSRRGVFSQERVMEIVRQRWFKASDQGVINYLFLRSLQDGKPSMGGASFQVIPDDGGILEPARVLPKGWNQPVVFHWMGKKPKFGRPAGMVDDFRREFLRCSGRRHGLQLSLRGEELAVLFRQHWTSVRKRLLVVGDR